ncbi:MAG: hypothetical protein ACRD30_11245 [Bryobacteraceae bacterium]
MFVHTLPQLVQDHGQKIAADAFDRLAHESGIVWLTGHEVRRDELLGWFEGIVAGVERWPGIALDDAEETKHREFGAMCRRRCIRLHELVRALHVLKQRIVDFARSRGLARNSLEIYVEEELENRVSFYFDWLVYQIVIGYEADDGLTRRA